MKDPSGFKHMSAIEPDIDVIDIVKSRDNKSADVASAITGNPVAGAISGAADAITGAKIEKSWNSKIFTPRTLRSAFSRNLGGHYVAKCLSKIAGPAGGAFMAISIWDNHANYEHSLLRDLVDVVALGFAAGVGILAGMYLLPTTAVTTGVVLIGVGIGVGASKIKRKYLSEKNKIRSIKRMKYDIKKKVLAFYDHENTNNSSLYYVSISIIAFLAGKSIGFNGIMSILIVLTISMALGMVIQIFRKDRNRRNITIYFFTTILGVFITTIVGLMQHYDNTGNDIGLANIIKTFLSTIALIADILVGIALSQKKHSKSKKITSVVVGAYMTIIAILAIIFLPFKNL